MLGGEYQHGLDAKNRLFIPAKFREELGETFIIARSLRENCLKVYSSEEWNSYVQLMLEKNNRSLQERVLRFLHASMTQVSPDSHGRVLLPKQLVDLAGLKKDVVIVGCFNYAEIWDAEAYENYKNKEDVDEMIRELETLGL
ncbi:MAG: division/cell wall cluster transcriptional repressor MraZ [Clostridia bacterium]|nr:division/cell wall cluster transcriptional repressor MraZ [Clostridia bacterium]